MEEILKEQEKREEIISQATLEKIANDNQLSAYKHHGFWKCMDALRDRVELEELWNTGKAKWKIW